MVDVKDFRIGNWIEAVAKMGNYYIRMTEYNFADLATSPNCANPIPLTPGILQKCGAVYIGREEDVYKLYIHEEEYLIFGKMKKNEVFVMQELHFTDSDGNMAFPYTFFPIEYLHQLQNRFYDLTGEELSIQL